MTAPRTSSISATLASAAGVESALQGLGGVTSTRSLRVTDNPTRASLGGLDALAEATEVLIDDNEALRSLTGLDALESSGGVYIVDSPGLQSLDGLGALREVDGELYVARNDTLADISAVEGLTLVTGDVTASDNLP